MAANARSKPIECTLGAPIFFKFKNINDLRSALKVLRTKDARAKEIEGI
jgi:hypothetical protein